MPNTKQMDTSTLTNLKITVIGAGPGGLSFARVASMYGATVCIVEAADDPRIDDAGYTDRSFNLTLNNVGRKVLGDSTLWTEGVSINGRAAHNPDESRASKYVTFDDDEASTLTSIPRPVLRRNLVSFALEHGVQIHFKTRAISLDPDEGTVTVEASNGTTEILTADLVVVADGINSIADEVVTSKLHGSLDIHPEPLNYVSVLLSKEACDGLSLHHMHFWHKTENGAVAIGMPNKDGTIAALLVSQFADIAPDVSPFANLEDAKARLERDFPGVLALDDQLAHQVIGRKRGRFQYKSSTDYVLGQRCVVIGDAGSATPPWAGFGANTALYSGDALARFLIGFNGNVYDALEEYQKHRLALAELVLAFANEHGEFLNKKVAKNPEQRPIGPVLNQLIHQAIKNSPVPSNVELVLC